MARIDGVVGATWLFGTAMGHVFAGTMLIAGIVVATVFDFAGILSMQLAVSCILVPPTAVYISWLWLFGPILTGKSE